MICCRSNRCSRQGVVACGVIPVAAGGSIALVVRRFEPFVFGWQPAKRGLAGAGVSGVFLDYACGEVVQRVGAILSGSIGLRSGRLTVGAPVGEAGGVEPVDERDGLTFHASLGGVGVIPG